MKKVLLGCCLIALNGCSSKSDSGNEDSDGSAKDTGTLAIDTVEEVGSLNLAESVSPDIPDSVAASGDGTSGTGDLAISFLTATGKSAEACYLREQMFQAKMQVDQIAMNLCMIQSQPGLKMGGKYKIEFGGPDMALTEDIPDDFGPDSDEFDMPDDDMNAGPVGGGDDSMPDMPESMSIYLDNSVEGQLTIFMCQDDELTDKFVLTDVNDNGARGAFKSKVEMNDFEVQIEGVYDNGITEAGRSVIASQSSFKMTMGSDSFYTRSKVMMSLKEDGISVLKIASENSDEAGDFSGSMKEVGAALIGPNIGSALFQRTFDGEDHPPLFEDEMALMSTNHETSRAFFDSAGKNLDPAASDSFKKDGLLYVSAEDLPKLMDDSFRVEFEDSDWDCSGTETVTLEENEKFNACNEDFAANFDTIDCMGDEFAPGSQVTDVDLVVDKRGEDFDPTQGGHDDFFNEIGDAPPVE